MTKRTVTIEDFQSFELPTNPLLSPDGKRLVYEVTTANIKADDYDVQLMVSDLAGEARALTQKTSKNHSAVWFPDGQRLAFLSSRAFGTQAWTLPMDGGEASQVTRFTHGISNLSVSSDGRTMYGLVPVAQGAEVEVYEVGVTEKEAKEQSDKAAETWSSGPKRYDWLYYKSDGVGFSQGMWRQLVAVDLESGAVRQVTHIRKGVNAYAVSPDGQTLAFTSNQRENPDVDWWYSDLFQVCAQGGDITCLTQGIIANQLSYAPDGSRIAIFGHGEEYDQYKSASHTHLFVVSSQGGSIVHVTKDFPDTLGDTNLTDLRGGVRAETPVWSADGQAIYTLSSREGRSEVVRFAATQGGLHEVVIGGDRDIFGFATDGADIFAITYATLTHPGHVSVVDIAETQPTKRTSRDLTEPMHQAPVALYPAVETVVGTGKPSAQDELNVIAPEPFWFTSQGGWQVQGWVIRPANFEAGKQYPVILEVHGGPQLNYGHTIFHEMQWLAAQGYAVVLTNPRGGMSYGQTFVNAVRLHYGEDDAKDVMNGLDAALSQFSFLDGSRVALTGGSYGGFMTNWLVGHTNRFFAAVSQRSISNWISFYGVSDIGPLFVESQLGANVMDDHEKLWAMSPLAYAKHVKTPLLLVHSENDLRCPIEQAEQFYTVLKRLEVDVELFRVPNASHGLSRNGKPKLRIERLQAIYQWIQDHLPDAQSPR